MLAVVKTERAETGESAMSGSDHTDEADSKNYPECSICNNKYEQPKILNCLHSFCQECLALLVTQSSQKNGANCAWCPECLEMTPLPETGVAGLRTNSYIVSLLNEVALQQQVVQSPDAGLVCDSCEQNNPAVSRCLECCVYLCVNCQTVHRRLPLLSKHLIASVDDIRSGTFAESPQRRRSTGCHRHPGEKSLLYCKTCHELVCVVCAVFDQGPNHVYVPVNTEELASAGRDSIKDTIGKLNMVLPVHEASLESLWKASEDFNKNIDKTKAQVRRFADEVRQKVALEEEQLLTEIDCVSGKGQDQFNLIEKRITSVVKCMHHSLDTANTIAVESTDSDFLSLSPVILKRLESLKKEKPSKINVPGQSLTFKGRFPLPKIGTLKY